MRKEKIPTIHPGEILNEEFIKPMGLTQNKLANALKVPPRRINEIVLGKRSITPDTALRLAKYFKISPEFWLGLQMDYDLDKKAVTNLRQAKKDREKGKKDAHLDLDTI